MALVLQKKKQDQMFESFSQGSVQINRKYGGTGLGLSIVKHIALAHRGTVNVTSEINKGSVFSLVLPLEN